MKRYPVVNDNYVYVYLDPRKPGNYSFGGFSFNFLPFYIGMGHGSRIHSHLKEAIWHRNDKKKLNRKEKLIRRLLGLGTPPIIIKLSKFLYRNEAVMLEKRLINSMGRVTNGDGFLLNMAEGGIGGRRDVNMSGKNNPFYGRTHTKEVRKRISIAAKKQGAHGITSKINLSLYNFSSTPEGRKLKSKLWSGDKNPAAIAKKEGRMWNLGDNNVTKRKCVSQKIRKTRANKNPVSRKMLVWLKNIDEDRIRLDFKLAKRFKDYKWLVLFVYDLRKVIAAFELKFKVEGIGNNNWILCLT